MKLTSGKYRNLVQKVTYSTYEAQHSFGVISEYINHLQKDDLIDAYFVCIKKKLLVERVAKKVSIQIITLKVEK